MRDNEFSSPGQEFNRPGQELSRPGQEWSAAGREYEQRQAPPPPRKKRRLSPLAMTAAAVVTVAVALAPQTAQREARIYPTCELTAEHRDYLDAVWGTMERRDLDRLAELAEDPRLEELVLDYIKPYAYEMEANYDDTHAVWSSGDELPPYEQSVPYHVYYNGDILGVRSDDRFPEGEELLWVGCSSLGIDSDCSFQLAERPNSRKLTPWRSFSFHLQKSPGGSWDYIYWYDVTYQAIQVADHGHITAPNSGVVRYLHASEMPGESRQITEERLSGEFSTVWEELPKHNSQPCYVTYLENGAWTYSYQDEAKSGQATLTVRDGYATPGDQTSVYSDGDWTELRFKCSDGSERTAIGTQAGAAADFLYHLIDYRSYSYQAIHN